MLCLVWECKKQQQQQQKHLSINAYLLPSLYLVSLSFYTLSLSSFLSTCVTWSWHGGMNGWICAQTRKQAGFECVFFFSGPCLWDCEQWSLTPGATLSSGPPESPGLAVVSALTPDFSPAWMDPVVAGIVSRLPVGKLSLGATEWELPLVYEKRKNHTLQQESFKKQTNKKLLHSISLPYNDSPSGIPSSWKKKDDDFKNP